jgi:ribosome maturation factor RimP
MLATNIVDRVTEIAERVTRSEGVELVEVEWKGGGNNRILRIFIDKPGGVTHADCENVSRQVGTILDVEDFIQVRYTLEVSSPGLDRKLVKPADYERFLGRKVRLELHQPLDGSRNLVGRLAAFHDGQVSLELDGGRCARFPLAAVKSARLVVEWRMEFEGS